MKRLLIPLGLFLAIGTGCSSADKPALTECSDPRPEICTQDYRPVCATRSDGSTHTYSNGCSACSDAAVVGWLEGACPEPP